VFFSNGTVSTEKLRVQELGYFGNFRELKLTVDARAYVETLRDLISKEFDTIPGYVVPPLVPFAGTPIPTQVFVNTPGFKTRGLEYQLRWKPFGKTEFWINQSFQRTIWEGGADKSYAPTHATSIAWFQKLPYDFDLSVIHHSTGSMSWSKAEEALPNLRRLDLRLAKFFKVGSTRAEASVTVQALNGNMPAYQGGIGYIFERRAFGSLRLEF
jgi:iron complex outermembrane receptor protein